MKVLYLKRGEIEAETIKLMSEYARRFGSVLKPPVPVEEIVDCHLGARLEFNDLNDGKKSKSVLGALNIETNKVIIDESLDPYEHPEKEGRYRFTLAHETGHYVLHRPQIILEREQPSLFGDAPLVKVIICRTLSNKDPMEWQADQFAGYLLMPRDMVLIAWEKLRGDVQPYIASGELSNLSARWRLAEKETPTVAIASDMAKQFKVSGQAMQIRLVELGLIRLNEDQREMFHD